jgi:hypothetical protein
VIATRAGRTIQTPTVDAIALIANVRHPSFGGGAAAADVVPRDASDLPGISRPHGEETPSASRKCDRVVVAREEPEAFERVLDSRGRARRVPVVGVRDPCRVAAIVRRRYP